MPGDSDGGHPWVVHSFQTQPLRNTLDLVSGQVKNARLGFGCCWILLGTTILVVIDMLSIISIPITCSYIVSNIWTEGKHTRWGFCEIRNDNGFL